MKAKNGTSFREADIIKCHEVTQGVPQVWRSQLPRNAQFARMNWYVDR